MLTITQAKQIPIEKLLNHYGAKFSHRRGHDAWYFSPLREESGPSFKVDERRNVWKDFGHTLPQGDIIDLYCDMNNRDRRDKNIIRLCLATLESIEPNPVINQPKPREPREYSTKYKILKRGKIWAPELLKNLEDRGLDRHIVAPYIQQGFIKDTQKPDVEPFNAFVWENDKGGIEVSTFSVTNKFKTCIGPKAASTFMMPGATTLMVMEGMTDFLTRRHMAQDPFTSFQVLNSTSLYQDACQHIVEHSGQYTSVLTFMDNNDAGQAVQVKIGDAVQEHPSMTIGAMNDIYGFHSDLNEWWMLDGRINSKAPEMKVWHEPNPTQAHKPKKPNI